MSERERGKLQRHADVQHTRAGQFVALTTVRSQIRAILRKLGVRSQLAAVAYVNRMGWTLADEGSLAV